MIEIGQPAPAFTLPDQDGKQVSLQDLAGRWVVLYFYPRDDTPGCTVEACEFTAGIAAFSNLTAVVYGCSADSPQSHQKFIQKHQLKVQLLSDADKQVMQAYGAYGEKVLYGKLSVGVIRSTVIISPDGRVAKHWPNVKAAGHAEEVRQALVQLQGGSAPAPAVAAEPTVVIAAPAAAEPTVAAVDTTVAKPQVSKADKPPAPPAPKTAAKPRAKAMKPAKKTAARPAKKATRKAAAKPAKKPVKKPAKKAAKKVARKPAKKATRKPAKKAAKKPVAKGKRR